MSIITANVTSTTSAVFTSSGNTAITYLQLCNYSAGNVTANIHIVPSGDSATNLNIAVSNLTIASEDSYQLYAGPEKILLENADTIQVDVSANSAVSAISSFTSI